MNHRLRHSQNQAVTLISREPAAALPLVRAGRRSMASRTSSPRSRRREVRDRREIMVRCRRPERSEAAARATMTSEPARVQAPARGPSHHQRPAAASSRMASTSATRSAMSTDRPADRGTPCFSRRWTALKISPSLPGVTTMAKVAKKRVQESRWGIRMERRLR